MKTKMKIIGTSNGMTKLEMNGGITAMARGILGQPGDVIEVSDREAIYEAEPTFAALVNAYDGENDMQKIAAELRATYPNNPELCELPDEQFEAGGSIDTLARAAGHCSGKQFANDYNLWGVHLSEVLAMLEKDAREIIVTIEVRSDDDGREEIEVISDGVDGLKAAATEAVEDWVKGGDWGTSGASVEASWRTIKVDGKEVDASDDWEYVTVEIEPDHGELIREAAGNEGHCGMDPEDHDWTSEGEGGCSENPGVWSLGGTKIQTAEHCRKCGLRRVEVSLGNQRNPGEHDTVSYEMPDAEWIAAAREAGTMDPAPMTEEQ